MKYKRLYVVNDVHLVLNEILHQYDQFWTVICMYMHIYDFSFLQFFFSLTGEESVQRAKREGLRRRSRASLWWVSKLGVGFASSQAVEERFGCYCCFWALCRTGSAAIGRRWSWASLETASASRHLSAKQWRLLSCKSVLTWPAVLKPCMASPTLGPLLSQTPSWPLPFDGNTSRICSLPFTYPKSKQHFKYEQRKKMGRQIITRVYYKTNLF